MNELGYLPFDADNHYYEAEDAFTRHIDRRMAKRGVEWVELRGRKRILVGGKLDKFIPNPSFDPVSKPGALEEYFRGENPTGKSMAELFGDLEPIRPEYRDRDARLKKLDEQGVGKALLFPTLGCGLEEPLRHDVEATHAVLSAFNRWLDETWGFAYQERLFAVPMLSLADPREAVAELEWALGRGARLLYLRPAPVPKASGTASLGAAEHDPFWARVCEAGVTVAFHTGDSGYGRYVKPWEGARSMEGFRGHAFGMATMPGRAIMDTFAALIVHGVFARHPNLRVASIENGSFWVPWLFKNLKKAHGQMGWAFAEPPIETFRRHVWVAPYFEDDARELADLIGVDHVLFGSDYPHAEGLARPLDFLKELEGFSRDELRRIMRDNAEFIATPRPA
jgi:predicted TIM-barrel fold metal-dependent hydrolase